MLWSGETMTLAVTPRPGFFVRGAKADQLLIEQSVETVVAMGEVWHDAQAGGQCSKHLGIEVLVGTAVVPDACFVVAGQTRVSLELIRLVTDLDHGEQRAV